MLKISLQDRDIERRIFKEDYFEHFCYLIGLIFDASLKLNIARCIANSICLVARKLESHCTSQILNE